VRLWPLLVALLAQPGPGPERATSEPSRAGAEYLVQRAGAVWIYQLEKGRGRVTITEVADWRAHFSFALGARTGSGTWWVRDGVWLERTPARGDADAVVLPARVSRGTHWAGPASIERGGGRPSQFEVLSLDAMIDLPAGLAVDHCLVVLELPAEGGEAWTHYYAPNLGKVAVRSPRDWAVRLVEFRPGTRHTE
jgi:hypothetical protein